MQTPCIGICRVKAGKCVGCYRTLEQISNWKSYSEEVRNKILKEIKLKKDK